MCVCVCLIVCRSLSLSLSLCLSRSFFFSGFGTAADEHEQSVAAVEERGEEIDIGEVPARLLPNPPEAT